MSINPTFQAASEAAASWLNTVAVVARLASKPNVDAAYRLLMPTGGLRNNLLDSYNEHSERLIQLFPEFAAVSRGPIEWEPGRGLSAVARLPVRLGSLHVERGSLPALAGPVVASPDRPWSLGAR